MKVKVEYKRSGKIKNSKLSYEDFPSAVNCSFEYLESPRSKKKHRGASVNLDIDKPA